MLIFSLLLVPLWITYKAVNENIIYSNYLTNIRKEQKLYKVASFENQDTIPLLAKDTIAWKQFAITGTFQNAAVVYNSKEETENYNYNFDTTRKLLTFVNPTDTSKKYIFTYAYPNKNQMLLTGNWKNKKVKILLDQVDINNFALVKDKTQWMYAVGVSP